MICNFKAHNCKISEINFVSIERVNLFKLLNVRIKYAIDRTKRYYCFWTDVLPK